MLDGLRRKRPPKPEQDLTYDGIAPEIDIPPPAAGGVREQEPAPMFTVVPYDASTQKPVQLTAASGGRMPKYHHWINPTTDVDHLAIGALVRSTVLGALSRTFVRFLVGNELRPQIELLDSTITGEAKEKELQKYQYVIDGLNAITAKIDDANDVSWQDTVTQLVQQVVDYGKGAILFKDFANPAEILLIESRDIGIIETDDWGNIQNVQVRFMQEPVSKDSIIYLADPIASSQTYHGGPYGTPIILNCVDSARTLLRVHKHDLHALARNTHAGASVLSVANQGQTESEKEDEYNQIVSRFQSAAALNVLLENPDDTRLDQINWHPEFDGLLETSKSLTKYMAACIGLPTALLDESISNRSSLLGKIQINLKSTVNPVRDTLMRSICRQFYQYHASRMFPELEGKARIKLHVDEITIATWIDLISAALALDGRAQLKPTAMSELIGLNSYESMTEPDADVQPGGGGPADLPKESFSDTKGEADK